MLVADVEVGVIDTEELGGLRIAALPLVDGDEVEDAPAAGAMHSEAYTDRHSRREKSLARS